MDSSTQALFDLAVIGQKNSYSPYSQRKVGAAIRLKDGRVFGGCNVENSSFGGTVCAERVAIFKAVSEGAKAGHPIEVTEVLVVTDEEAPWPPCGLCRQVLAEFAADSAKVYRSNLKGKLIEQKFSELYPDAFRPRHLLGG